MSYQKYFTHKTVSEIILLAKIYTQMDEAPLFLRRGASTNCPLAGATYQVSES